MNLQSQQFLGWVPDEAFLIRIVGARRMPSGDRFNPGFSTHYAWKLVYHLSPKHPPGSPADSQKPLDKEPRLGSGPLFAEAQSGSGSGDAAPIPAIEISGSDAVPTDGTVCVWAWYDDTCGCLRFQYTGRRFARLDALARTNGSCYYAWTEMEPAAPGSGDGSGSGSGSGSGLGPCQGFLWQEKLLGITGLEAELVDGTKVPKNPLYDVSNSEEVPIGSIVEIYHYPVRRDPLDSFSYYRGYPEGIVRRLTSGSLALIVVEVQSVSFPEASSGFFTLTVRTPQGYYATTALIDYGASATDVAAALNAMFLPGRGGNFLVASDGQGGYVITFPDKQAWPLITADSKALGSSIPWFFQWAASPGLVRFKLFESLPRCGHAQAAIVPYHDPLDWCDEAQIITVYDSIGLKAMGMTIDTLGIAGDMGWAVLKSDSAKYEVTAMGKSCCTKDTYGSGSGSGKHNFDGFKYVAPEITMDAAAVCNDDGSISVTVNAHYDVRRANFEDGLFIGTEDVP